MPAHSVSQLRFEELLLPYYPKLSSELVQSLSVYLDVLLKWNAHMNLSAIRDPEEIVRRHFGESLFVARHLPLCETLLDFGSGAGFPGVPIQLALPHLSVTLGEAQNRKASFLREVVRSLSLPTEVWGLRVEAMPSDRKFDVVAMRAVDDPEKALDMARSRLKTMGSLALLTTEMPIPETSGLVYKLPGSDRTILRLSRLPSG